MWLVHLQQWRYKEKWHFINSFFIQSIWAKYSCLLSKTYAIQSIVCLIKKQITHGPKQISSLAECIRPVFVSQIQKRSNFCWVEPTPLVVNSYTHLLYKVRDPFHFFCTIWTTNHCFTDQETREVYFLGGTNSFVGQFLPPSLVQSSRSIPLFLYNLDDKSLFHRSRNSGREFVGWNQLLCRSILTPTSCTKFKIYSTFLVQFGRQIYISLQLCFDFWWFFFHLNSKRNLSPNISSLHDADWSLERPLEWLLLL